MRDDLRDLIVPINKKYPIAELLQACRVTIPAPPMQGASRFEYVMLKGVNDTLADAKELVRLVKGIPAKINLIPFNPWPGAPYECSDWSQIEKFAEVVNKAGYASPVRTPRGRDRSWRLAASSRARASGNAPPNAWRANSRRSSSGCHIRTRHGPPASVAKRVWAIQLRS